MGLSQMASSFQNDGNFSQLDLRESQGGPILRIETFRCSQPEGPFGRTASGTSVKAIAGLDHLSNSSNRTFRHIFSSGTHNNITTLLEIRESFEEDGSFTVVVRDVDGRSASFGHALLATAKPVPGGSRITYEITAPSTVSYNLIRSPIPAPLTDLVENLPEISLLEQSARPKTGIGLFWEHKNDNAANMFRLSRFADSVQREYGHWSSNVQLYERMGNSGVKCIHHGTNLVGDHVELASEYVSIGPCHGSLIAAGMVFDPAMGAGASKIAVDRPLPVDTKPGVYAMFLSAYALNIGLYQLGLDKVHSDYGGIPMALKPGSRLENNSSPVVDASNFNRTLAALSAIFYAPNALCACLTANPAINAFEVEWNSLYETASRRRSKRRSRNNDGLSSGGSS